MQESYTISIYFVLFCWGAAIFVLIHDLLFVVYTKKEIGLLKYFTNGLTLGGLAILAFSVIRSWLILHHPPMKTTGDTRIWFSAFIVLISLIIYRKWRYKILIGGGLLFGIIFLGICLLYPESMAKSLTPALQSNWFVPHVVVYILAYSILGMSFFVAITGLISKLKIIRKEKLFTITDNLVYMGFGFLTLGLVFGAFWAKETWGHYWTWDPKESWALITWLTYMLYIHYRLTHKKDSSKALWILIIAFAILIVCWFGISYLTIGNGSIHSY